MFVSVAHSLFFIFYSCYFIPLPCVSPYIALVLSVSFSPSPFNSRLLNVGHSVWKLPSPFSLSISRSLFVSHSVHRFLPLLLLHRGCNLSGLGAGCRIACLAGYRCTGYDLYCIWRVEDLHNYKARPHLYPGISGEISSALSLATCRWRLSIARAQAAARLFLKEGREKPLALLLPSYSHPKKDPWNVACSLASKIHHIGPNFVFFPLTFCVSLLAGRLSCTYSFCQDDTPSIFEATLSTRQEDRDS